MTKVSLARGNMLPLPSALHNFSKNFVMQPEKTRCAARKAQRNFFVLWKLKTSWNIIARPNREYDFAVIAAPHSNINICSAYASSQLWIDTL